MRSLLLRVSAGALLLALGITGVLAMAFLLAWERGADGARDIAARGPFLLALFLPDMAGAAAVVTVVVAGVVAWRRRAAAPGALLAAAGLGAGVAAAATLATYGGAVFWPGGMLPRPYGGAAVAAVALAQIAAGMWLIRRRSRVV